ncbi:MAG TPA: PepSY domain-containing protein, partial [Candidatus Humimicrobiaceae bacterium]|nr:PepSY domain-containing protein [Candidatus Humimicrobiaceae bacterium]
GTNLTQEEAVNIAMTVASGTVDEIETEVEHGELIWKIRIVSGESRTVVRIKDSTGEIVRVETD